VRACLRIVDHALGHIEHIAGRHREVLTDERVRVVDRIRRAAVDVAARELLQQAALRVGQLGRSVYNPLSGYRAGLGAMVSSNPVSVSEPASLKIGRKATL
jgi:hypothetical protein